MARQKIAQPAPRGDEYTAVVPGGLENILAEELRRLGAGSVRPLRRAVAFRGDQRLFYRAHIELRSAVRILKPLSRFRARSEQDLYRGVFETDLRTMLPPKHSFQIDGSIHSTIFRHSGYAALKAKDAIVDRQRRDLGARSSINLKKPDVRLHLYIDQDQVIFSADATGEPLHRRGYRADHGPASLMETLAYSLGALSGWKPEQAFVDPMCGAGTIPIEAAMAALDIAPGMKRHFAFERWPDFDFALLRSLREEAEARADQAERKQPQRPIVAADIDERSLHLARSNAARARVAHAIEFYKADARELVPPHGPGVVVVNPPYGERMKGPDLVQLYKQFGQGLAQNFGGYRVWIFSANFAALDAIELERGRTFRLKNGPLDCELREFTL